MMKKEAPSSAWKLARYIFIVYSVGSLFFTLHHFYATHTSPKDNGSLYPRAGDEALLVQSNKVQHTYSSDRITWTNKEGIPESMSETYIMSKLFAESVSAHSPGQIKPYFYKAQSLVRQQDITLSTLVTRNRFPVLSRLATHYQGPISAALHVNEDDDKDVVLQELAELYRSNLDMHRFVDLHLIVDKHDRQFNMWRNVAKLFTRTDYLMMLDVDFHLCTDFRHRILNNPSLLAMLDTNHAFVVPAFEYIAQEDGLDSATFPTSKQELLAQVEKQQIDMFHRSWQNGHGATNYSHWYTASDVYPVTDYHFSYEPYIIFRKDGTPWCDERFTGYGGNKAACLYELHLSGMQFEILPDDFLIHQTHSYPESTRRKERQYNRKLYGNFREELCVRYAKRFIANGEWDTDRSSNLQKECNKIRSFRTSL
ncbi:glycosyl-transferase for dystroglycan-domain-containing protein [Gongronella butleri]|nr:glycosyl-transferase for dystroglycan-domain-containing protein [Gongronella butleri]